MTELSPRAPGALIPTFEGHLNGQAVLLCQARDLHAFLEVGRDFTTWIKGRIHKYGFVEGQDYLLTKTGEQLPSGTKYRDDYHLTLDTAKELAMVENNDQGRRVRRYFIELERRGNAAEQAVIAELSARLARMEQHFTVREWAVAHPDAVLSDEEKQAVLDGRKGWRLIHELVSHGLNSEEIGLKLNRDASGVRRIIRQMRRCGILPPDARQYALKLERRLIARHAQCLEVEV